MCKDHQAEVKRNASADSVGYAMSADKETSPVKTFREIDVSEVENGFAVKIRRQSRRNTISSHLAILGVSCDERVFVAKNLEEVTEIILSEGRKAA